MADALPSPPTAAQIRAKIEADAATLAADGSHHPDSALARAMAAHMAALKAMVQPLVDESLTKPFDVEGLKAGREANKAIMRSNGFRVDPEYATDASLDKAIADATGVECWWYKWPGCDETAVIIGFHGGGRTVGSAAPSGGEGYWMEQLSRVANAPVLSVEYALAPEANGTQQVEDCLRVYKYVLETLKIPSSKVAFVGCSGGGSLNLSVQLAIGRRHLPAPAAAFASSPMTTYDSFNMPSMKTNMATDVLAGYGAGMYARAHEAIANVGLPTAMPVDHPDVSPLSGDFTQITWPLRITASKAEVLFSETKAVVEKARAAGVAVTARFFAHVVHCHIVAAEMMPEGREELGCAGAWLSDKLHGAE